MRSSVDHYDYDDGKEDDYYNEAWRFNSDGILTHFERTQKEVSYGFENPEDNGEYIKSESISITYRK